MIVTNAAMHVRVADLSASIATIRSLTLGAGGTISQLTLSDNSESPTDPQPIDAASATTNPSVRKTPRDGCQKTRSWR